MCGKQGYTYQRVLWLWDELGVAEIGGFFNTEFGFCVQTTEDWSETVIAETCV
jgi:hypothetical protein